jgi:hypothetical protein
MSLFIGIVILPLAYLLNILLPKILHAIHVLMAAMNAFINIAYLAYLILDFL